MKQTLRQFIKFALAGGMATLINLICLYFFTDFFGVYYLLSALFAFLIADISKYLISKGWVFNWRRKKRFFNIYFKFFTVGIIVLILNILFLYLFTEFLGIYYLLSQIMAIALSFWINFFGNKFWTFNKDE